MWKVSNMRPFWLVDLSYCRDCCSVIELEAKSVKDDAVLTGWPIVWTVSTLTLWRRNMPTNMRPLWQVDLDCRDCYNVIELEAKSVKYDAVLAGRPIVGSFVSTLSRWRQKVSNIWGPFWLVYCRDCHNVFELKAKNVTKYDAVLAGRPIVGTVTTFSSWWRKMSNMRTFWLVEIL
jgi:hypothetical protein